MKDSSILDVKDKTCEQDVKETLCNDCETELIVEGGYSSCDELEFDSTPGWSASVSSSDAGYLSLSDEEITNTDGEKYKALQFSKCEISFHENNIGLLDENIEDFPQSLKFLAKGVDLNLPQEYSVLINRRPDWLDMDKFKAGQKFAMDHYVGLNYSQMISLFILFSMPDGLEPLVFTDKSSTPFTAYKRYLSTSLRVKSWFENDLWTEGNEGFRNIKAVRALHLKVSNNLSNCSREVVKDYSVLEGSKRHPNLWCPLHSNWKKYFSTSQETTSSKILNKKYFTNKKRIYLNQSEMSGTQFGFFGLMVMYPEKFGAGGATREDLENFIHCWRGIGYLLGISDEFNFCSGSLDQVLQRCHDFVNEIVKPNFRNLSKDWEHMSRCAIEGIRHYIPSVSFETSFAYLCWVIDMDASEYFSSLTWSEYFQFHKLKFFFCFILRIPGVLPYLNKLTIRIIEAHKSVSTEKLEFLKNKKYPYQNEDVITRL